MTAGPVSAAFENSYFSPRMKGLGSAFVAVSDDYYTSLLNPAGLATLDRLGFSVAYGKPFWGYDEDFKLDNLFASVVYPNLKAGTFNFYYSRFSVTELYAESIYSLNYGVSLNNFLKKLLIKVNTGIGLKILNKSYTLDKRTENDPVFKDGTTGTGFSMDYGLILAPFRKGSENYYNFGISVQNINQPDMGFISEDVVYRKYNLGFAYYILNKNLFKGSIIMPAAQISYENEQTLICLGAEIWVYRKLLGIRAGWNSNEISTGLSFNYSIKQKFEIDFDYSFLLSSQLVENSGTHTFALTFRFLKLLL